MNREVKAQFIEEIKGQFLGAPLIVLTDFKGSTVKEIDVLRRACEAKGLGYRVVKNTLCVRAIQGTPLEALSEHFKGNTGVLFSGEDPIAAAKIIKEQVKDKEKLKIKVGYFDGDVLDEKGVFNVATLPGRAELSVMLLRTLQEAPRQVLGVIRAPARDLLYVLSNFAAKLEKAS